MAIGRSLCNGHRQPGGGEQIGSPDIWSVAAGMAKEDQARTDASRMPPRASRGRFYHRQDYSSSRRQPGLDQPFPEVLPIFLPLI